MQQLGSRLFWYILILVGTAVYPVFAQEAPEPRRVKVSLDHASFAYEGGNSLFEIYLSFEVKSLPFRPVAEGGLVALVPIQWRLTRNTVQSDGKTVAEAVRGDAMRLAFPIADTTFVGDSQVFQYLIRDLVPPGEYELILKILPDATLGIVGESLTRQVTVRNFMDQTPKANMSDIMFASAMEPSSNRDDAFYRSGLSVRPNPNQLYGNGVDKLLFYAEAYQISQIKINPEQAEYTLLAYVSAASAPQAIPGLEIREKRTLRENDVLTGSFDVSKLVSGAYFLRVAILNENNEAVLEQRRKFFIYNPNIQLQETKIDPDEDFLASVFVNMTEEEVADEMEHIKIISTTTDERQMAKLATIEAKRRWLYDYWLARDTNPQTSINEYRMEFYENLRMAKDRYSNKFTIGWKTDRGRTLLKYGLPSSTQPNLSRRETVPYEIWEYNNIPGEGRAEFIFADMSGFGEFELIHATVSGSRKSPNWQAEIIKKN
ncbi:MAG: GWxTD domain-containing protein [Bacteroidetes Order II. Incertae sedis bacterium]|nr:GWxTD domain-containing protein [Bacteroidetes Order II. bacterium]